MKHFLKNRNILHRKEGENNYLLFNPYERYYIILTSELFGFWDNIEAQDLGDYLRNIQISDNSIKIILNQFIKDKLIVEG